MMSPIEKHNPIIALEQEDKRATRKKRAGGLGRQTIASGETTTFPAAQQKRGYSDQHERLRLSLGVATKTWCTLFVFFGGGR